MTIVEAEMGKWPQAAPDKEEIVTMEFKEGEQARAVAPSMLCVPNGQRGLRLRADCTPV